MVNPLENSKNLTNSSASDCYLPLVHAIALMTTNSLTAVLGTFGNILVCVAVATNSRLRRCSNFILVSLAIADLIVTMVCAPLLVAMVCKIALTHDCPNHLELAYSIAGHLSCSSSILHLAGISIDRFLAVIFPLRYGSIMKKYGLKTILVTVWFLAVAIVSLRVPFLEETTFFALVMFVASYATIAVSYLLIVIFLIKERLAKKHLTARRSAPVNFQVECRVSFTLAIVIGIFSACWFPLIISFFATGHSLVKLHGPAFLWIRTLALSNSAMNLLIYSWRIRDFRNAYVVICRKIVGCTC
ncbi:adenosine receptor A2a-like [Oculina patagonica]